TGVTDLDRHPAGLALRRDDPYDAAGARESERVGDQRAEGLRETGGVTLDRSGRGLDSDVDRDRGLGRLAGGLDGGVDQVGDADPRVVELHAVRVQRGYIEHVVDDRQ